MASVRLRRSEGPVEAGAFAGVAGAVPLLFDDEEQGVAVAVVVRRRGPTGGRPDVSPLRQRSWRLRDQNTVRPDSSVSARVSSFIQAIISTAPVPCSWTMAGTSPSAL